MSQEEKELEDTGSDSTKTNSAWHIIISLITNQESRNQKTKEVLICYKDIKTDKKTHGCATNVRKNTK